MLGSLPSVTAMCIGLALALPAFSQEHKIDRSQLPPAVQKTIDEQSRGATLKSLAIEVEHGKKYYEAEMEVDGHSKDLQINPDGTLNAVEEEVAFDKLPVNIQTSLTKKAAGAKITKVESLTQQGKVLSYEAAIMKNGKASEVKVNNL